MQELQETLTESSWEPIGWVKRTTGGIGILPPSKSGVEPTEYGETNW